MYAPTKITSITLFLAAAVSCQEPGERPRNHVFPCPPNGTPIGFCGPLARTADIPHGFRAESHGTVPGRPGFPAYSIWSCDSTKQPVSYCCQSTSTTEDDAPASGHNCVQSAPEGF